eukprot:354941-Chlamydomonas_euryale.AAC.8
MHVPCVARTPAWAQSLPKPPLPQVDQKPRKRKTLNPNSKPQSQQTPLWHATTLQCTPDTRLFAFRPHSHNLPHLECHQVLDRLGVKRALPQKVPEIFPENLKLIESRVAPEALHTRVVEVLLGVAHACGRGAVGCRTRMWSRSCSPSPLLPPSEPPFPQPLSTAPLPFPPSRTVPYPSDPPPSHIQKVCMPRCLLCGRTPTTPGFSLNRRSGRYFDSSVTSSLLRAICGAPHATSSSQCFMRNYWIFMLKVWLEITACNLRMFDHGASYRTSWMSSQDLNVLLELGVRNEPAAH